MGHPLTLSRKNQGTNFQSGAAESTWDSIDELVVPIVRRRKRFEQAIGGNAHQDGSGAGDFVGFFVVSVWLKHGCSSNIRQR